MTVSIGIIAPADLPPEEVTGVARSAEAAGIAELWLWEDCFAGSGPAPAAAALAATERLTVGIGLMPVPLRVPSLTAMEIASLARMFPGRIRPGVGHGVAEWMAQCGVKVASPLTLLREHISVITAMLAGESVTMQGRYVHVEDVQLRYPPRSAPGLLVGGRGPKTLTIGAELGAGVILDDVVAPSGEVDSARLAEIMGTVRPAWEAAGRQGQPDVVAFAQSRLGTSPDDLRATIRALADGGVTTVAVLAGGIDGPPSGDPVVIRALIETLAAL